MTDGVAPDSARLSLNQITVDQLGLAEAVAHCAEAGIRWIGPWREKVMATGLEESARLIREAGLGVSSLCRGGFFAVGNGDERSEDNRRAVEEAAALGAGTLVLVCGPAPDGDLRSARRAVAEGIEGLAPYAEEMGVRLGIEPLHPMMAAERSVVVTLAEALALASRFDAATVGVVVDAYHVWWDPELEAQLERCTGRIAGYHVSDWLVPTTDVLAGRGLMGDGVLELQRIRTLVEASGYRGPIEVEVINPALRSVAPAELLRDIRRRFLVYA